VLDLVEDDFPGAFDFVLVRHLMYHLTIDDNLRVIEKLGRPYIDGHRHYVMLSTYLEDNENEYEYRLVV